MAYEHSLFNFTDFTYPAFNDVQRRTVASYERELTERRVTEIQLREALASEAALLRQKDELIRHRELLSREADHRLMNGLQTIVSLLSLQSRAETNSDAAAHLSVAANRVATIARIHRHLHSLDGVTSVAFGQFLDELCREYTAMLSSDDRCNQSIVVDGGKARLPAATAIPLSLIANELITNAAKHGGGAIIVRFDETGEGSHLLSVCNAGPALPADFDPAISAGLGMKIVQALVKQIGGKLQIDRCHECQGTRFTVTFA